MRRLIEGSFARFLGSIPVERPRDLAKPATGVLI